MLLVVDRMQRRGGTGRYFQWQRKPSTVRKRLRPFALVVVESAVQAARPACSSQRQAARCLVESRKVRACCPAGRPKSALERQIEADVG